jgi:hypothetical protein
MRKGWLPRAKLLATALQRGQDAFWGSVPRPEFEEVDYAVATAEDEEEVQQRNSERLNEHERETAGGIAFLTAWWGTASDPDQTASLLSRLLAHPCNRENVNLIAGASTIWRGESEWACEAPDESAGKIRGVIELRTSGTLRSSADAKALIRVLSLAGGLLVNPPRRFAERCSTAFPQGSNRSDEFRGAFWILSESLRNSPEPDHAVAYAGTPLLDCPIAADRLPFSAGDWRELYGRVRRSVREGARCLADSRGAYVPARMMLFHPEWREQGVWLPKFDRTADWVVQTRTVELAPAGVALMNRIMAPDVAEEPKDLLTKAEAARKAQIGASTLYRWIEEGKVRTYGSRKLVSLSEVRAVPRGVGGGATSLAGKMRRKRKK